MHFHYNTLSLCTCSPHEYEILVPDKGNPGDRSRSKYIKVLLEKKQKYTSENGVAKAVRDCEDLNVKDSSVRDWRDTYLKEVHIQRKAVKPGEEIVVTKLPSKKRGRPVRNLISICKRS